MNIADVSGIVDNWTEQVNEIIKVVDEWSQKVIEIHITKEQADSNDKFNRIKAAWEKFVANINARLAKLREKIVTQLRKIYEQAMEHFKPWKEVYDIIMILPNLSISLDTIVKVVTAVIQALVAIAKLFFQLYMEALETIMAVSNLAAKLASFQVPKVIFTMDGTSWQPESPGMEQITLADITGGSESSVQTAIDNYVNDKIAFNNDQGKNNAALLVDARERVEGINSNILTLQSVIDSGASEVTINGKVIANDNFSSELDKLREQKEKNDSLINSLEN